MSSLKRNPPFRAEHIGSLLRPQDLIELRYAIAQKRASPSDLIPVEQKSVKDIVELQQGCGFHAITNGEHSRHQFWGTFFETLEGMEEVNLREGGFDRTIFRQYAPDVQTYVTAKTIPNQVTLATGKIRHGGISSYMPEVDYLKSLLPETQWKNIKLTVASPSWYHLRYAPRRAYLEGVYDNDQEYFTDIAKAYQVEIGILYKAGIRNIQIDDPNLAYFCSEAMLKGWKEDSTNFLSSDEQLDAYIQFYNACFERPADMHLGIHLCRGNYMGSRHFSEGAYDAIAKKMFTELNVDTFYLEYDTPRAGGFEPLVFLPRNKNAVLGVVTSKFPQLEDEDEMVKRVYEAADYVARGSQGQTREEALQRLSVSPQCGFASHAEGNTLTHDDMKRKLELVRRIANRVWPGED